MWPRTHDWGGHRPQGDTTAIILLNGCNIKASSKVASLYLSDLIRRISLCSGWQLTQKFRTRAKPKCDSVTNGTSVSYPFCMRLRDHCRRGEAKTVRARNQGENRMTVSLEHNRTLDSWTQSCGCLHKIKPANIPVQSRQGAHESPLLTEKLLAANGFWRQESQLFCSQFGPW